MPLLQSNDTAPEQESQEVIEQPEEMTEGDGGFDSSTIENSIMEQLDEKAAGDVKRVVEAGSKILFSEGGFELFEDMRPEEEVPLADELGSAAVNFMFILIDKSGGTMPGQAIAPSGVILMARAAHFMNENGIAEVTYDTFSEATKLFTEVIASKLGGEGEEEMPEEEVPLEQPQQPMQQPGNALLNQGGV